MRRSPVLGSLEGQKSRKLLQDIRRCPFWFLIVGRIGRHVELLRAIDAFRKTDRVLASQPVIGHSTIGGNVATARFLYCFEDLFAKEALCGRGFGTPAALRR
jgi:hypothetical protein